MIITENPELRKQVYDNIRETVCSERTGVHLSDLIYCSRKAYWRKLGMAAAPSDDLCVLWMTGYAFQAFMFPHDEEVPVVVDGVNCTPDIPTGIEVKSTRRSSRKFDLNDITQYKRQILGYCKALGKLEYDLAVLFVCGNYCLHPDTRVLKADLTWDSLGNIKVGDILIGVDEFPLGKRGRRKLRYATIDSLAPVELPSSHVVLKDGRRFVASDEHLWLEVVASGGSNWSPRWTRTADLIPGSKLRQLAPPWETREGYDAGYLAASLDSEGDIEVKNPRRTTLRVGYSQVAGITYDRVRRLFDQFGIRVSSKDASIKRLRTQGMDSALRLLGSIRPERLLNKFEDQGGVEGMGLPATRSIAEVESILSVGLYPLIGIETSTGTLIAEGLVSHNSPPFPSINCWHIETTEEEVEANWDEVLQRAVKIQLGLQNQSPPEPDCMPWEWEYCECIEYCKDTVCYRKKQMKGNKRKK